MEARNKTSCLSLEIRSLFRRRRIVASRQTVLITTIVLITALGCWGQAAPQTSTAATSGSAANSDSTEASVPVVDNRPPSGAQPVGLGIGGRKEVNISLNASQSWDSSPPVSLNSSKSWEPEPSVGGTLQLSFDTTKAQTRLNYDGSVIGYPDGSPAWRAYQNFGFFPDREGRPLDLNGS